MNEPREKLAEWLYEHHYPRMYWKFAELKENYAGSAECICNEADSILDLLSDEGMVMLDEDQGLSVYHANRMVEEIWGLRDYKVSSVTPTTIELKSTEPGGFTKMRLEQIIQAANFKRVKPLKEGKK